MSVRAMVWFPGNGQDANERGTYVFAHGGGDPHWIVPLLLRANDLGRTPVKGVAWPEKEYDESWKMGRAGYAASLFCSTEPKGLQVDTYPLLDEGRLYGDLDYLYVVRPVVGDDRRYTWHVEVRVPTRAYLDEPTPENTRVLARSQPVAKLARYYTRKASRRRKAVAA
ncbi:hypothetical protein [Tautonia plasticadhaerens]|uniref:Uncharacterized protein n=1 Tax=Tautonia plasticadhaerens TaxID=2527974 RepID=A0A518H408_9BACT|nr:hypothetical protein [Tautonia plasticadhaerens]QDV35591.1 hypothetical protein ElP_34950 [Tautonia plasticadhaerens]